MRVAYPQAVVQFTCPNCKTETLVDLVEDIRFSEHPCDICGVHKSVETTCPECDKNVIFQDD